jgi:hypothetical protein
MKSLIISGAIAGSVFGFFMFHKSNLPEAVFWVIVSGIAGVFMVLTLASMAEVIVKELWKFIKLFRRK